MPLHRCQAIISARPRISAHQHRYCSWEINYVVILWQDIRFAMFHIIIRNKRQYRSECDPTAPLLWRDMSSTHATYTCVKHYRNATQQCKSKSSQRLVVASRPLNANILFSAAFNKKSLQSGIRLKHTHTRTHASRITVVCAHYLVH